MKVLTLCVWLVGLAPMAAAQITPTRTPVADPPPRYATESIYLQQRFLGGSRFVQEKTFYPLKRLPDALTASAEAEALSRRGLRLVRASNLVSLLTVAATILPFVTDDDALEVGASVTGFSTALIGTGLRIRGMNRVQRAVWMHNRALAEDNLPAAAVR